jgi:hypothetical protein
MAPFDVARDLSEILSALGKGWGWAVLLLLATHIKKRRECAISGAPY